MVRIMKGFRLCDVLGHIIAFLLGFFLGVGVAHDTRGSMKCVPVRVQTMPLLPRASHMKHRVPVTRWALLSCFFVFRGAAYAEPRHYRSSHALC